MKMHSTVFFREPKIILKISCILASVSPCTETGSRMVLSLMEKCHVI